MDRSKMSGIDIAYGEDIHQVVDGIPEPNDDSITLSSFENSQMTYSKSFTKSKMSRKGRQNNGYRNKRDPYDNDQLGCRSPYDRNEKTLTVDSVPSSPLDLNSRSREERKHENSPNINDGTLEFDNSHGANQFMSRNLGRDDNEDAYDNQRSINYGEDSLDDNLSPHFRPHHQLTEDSNYNEDSNVSGYVESVMTSNENKNRHTRFTGRQPPSDSQYYTDEGESDFYEGEESEYEDEYSDNNQMRYHRRHNDSLEDNGSLADHSRSEFIDNKELTGGILHKQSLGENTNEYNQFTGSNFKQFNSDEEYESEEEEDEESDINIESQISGYDSLSQTHKSKVSSKKFKKSEGFNRNSNTRKTGNFPQQHTDSSQFNDTDSYHKMPEGTQSIGLKSRNDRNDESLSCDQSNESWCAVTPREAIVAPRTMKESNRGYDYIHSPDGKSLIIDESMRHDRNGPKASQGTDQNYSRSNLYENSDGHNSKTVSRQKRVDSKIKKAKKVRDRNKNNSLIRTSGNLPRDLVLEQALEKDLSESNHINLNEDEFNNRDDASETRHRKLENIEIHEYRKLIHEHSILKAQLAKVSAANNIKKERLERQNEQIQDLTSKLCDEETKASDLADKLNIVNDLKKGVGEYKIKELLNDKLKRTRKQLTSLKKDNTRLEEENASIKSELRKYDDMDQYYLSEIDKLKLALNSYQIKEEHMVKIQHKNKELEDQCIEWRKQCEDLVNRANKNIGDLEYEFDQCRQQLVNKQSEIERLQKQYRDNEHLFTKEDNVYRQHLAEIDDLKKRLNEVTDELDEYKMLSKNNPMSSKVDVDKELQMKEQIHQRKLQSAHQQIDQWKQKYEESEGIIKSLKKQVKILENSLANKENNNSTAIIDQSSVTEVLDRIKDLFELPQNSELFSELEKVKIDLETLDALKEELEKARKMYSKLEEKHQKFLSKQSKGDMNEYSQGLIASKNEELDQLNHELQVLRQKLEEAENIRWELSHEKHGLISRTSELQKIIKDKDLEITRIRKQKEESDFKNIELKEGANEIIRQKKELERKIKELENQDDLERSKSSKDIEHLKKESSSLVQYILSLEFAYDEEFEQVFKNQSYANEHDQARKHLENQRDIVSSQMDRLHKDLETQNMEVLKYKEYIKELEGKIENVDNYKSESVKWKQSYERLAITLKNSQGKDSKDPDRLIHDLEALQNTLADIKLDNTKKTKEIQSLRTENESVQKTIDQQELTIVELKKSLEEYRNKPLSESVVLNTQNSNLILKLEKENKRLETENTSLTSQIEHHRKIASEISEKYQISIEKSMQSEMQKSTIEALTKENKSLSDQLTILKKLASEHQKSVSESTEIQLTSLKATLTKKENAIKELKTQNQLLQNLLDEARQEIQGSESDTEKVGYNECILILDTIISKPLFEATSQSKEFLAIHKRVQMVREQVEQGIVDQILEASKTHLGMNLTFIDKNLNDTKSALVETFAGLKEKYRVTYDEHNDQLDISTESKSLRKPYGYKDKCIDIYFVFEQFTDVFKVYKDSERYKEIDTLKSELRAQNEEKLTLTSNEFYERFEQERKQLITQMNIEKESEFKIRENKIIKEYESKRAIMFEQFETLKKEFQDKFTEQSKKYQEISEEDINRQRQELERQKDMYEKDFEERVQRKISALEGMFNTRKIELEDEFTLKKQRLEFEMKTNAETQDHKNKVELESLVDKFQAQAEEKIKRIQNEADMKVQEAEEKVKAKCEEVKKLKFEHDKKIKDNKKTMEREIKFKSDTLQSESKSKIDRELKKYKEQIEDLETQLKEHESKLNEEKKKYKELSKSISEKHKAEIRNLKNTHENELVRRKIEQEKEVKKAKRDLEIEIENLRKEHEVQVMDKLLAQKKDLTATHTQKLKLEKEKFEKALFDRENEINQKHNEEQVELLKRHSDEMQQLKDTLTTQYENLRNATIDNIKAEYRDQCEQELKEEYQCATERIKKQYQLENENLKLKLQEISDTQSMVSQHDRLSNADLIYKENESVQTEDITFPINANEMAERVRQKEAKNTPFDYEAMINRKMETGTQYEGESDEEEKPRKPPTSRTINTARTDKELIDAMQLKSKQDLNTLQHRYEMRITELLENHMAEIQETKHVTTLVTVRKLERILILELDKMCQAIMCKSREEAMSNNQSANLIIANLIVDLTNDNSTHENLERIKKKLNEVLIKYKQKVDVKIKQKMEEQVFAEKKKLQGEYERMREALEHTHQDSPSVMDTGVEHNSPEKRIRQSVSIKEFADFSKEYRLCDKKVYNQNILTRVCPPESDKVIVVDLNRIVSDLNMIKNSLAASARQLGFTLIEPHKIDQEEYQEQVDPNVPEPVYTISQQYRHLLNTFLRFSRDVIINVNGETDVRCFKENEQKEKQQKQEVMGYQLQIADLKEKVRKLDRELKLLQGIYQNHLESRLQIIDLNDYDVSKMTEETKECAHRIKETYTLLMDLQTLFLRHGNDINSINEECEEYLKNNQDYLRESTYNNLEFDVSCPQDKFDKIKRNTFNHGTRTRNSHHDFAIRNSTEVARYTAQLPRSTEISGGNTARTGYISPKSTRNLKHCANRGSTEDTKSPYLFTSENIESSAKPPKFKRDMKRSPRDSIHLKSRNYLQERDRITQPNKSLERRSSFDHFNIQSSLKGKGMNSTQSVQNLSKFIEPHSFREDDDSELTKAQQSVNLLFENLKNSKFNQ